MRRALSIDVANAAVLLVDLQEEHRGDQRYLAVDFEATLAKARRVMECARGHGVPVVHAAYIVDASAQAFRPFHPLTPEGVSAFSDSASPLAEICPEVRPIDGETVLIKTEASVFGDGALERKLRADRVEWLFVCGVWTEACVDATVRHAVDRGFRVALVKDACGSGSVAMHQTAILNLANRLYGGAVDADGACRLIAGQTVEAWRTETPVPIRYTYENAATIYADL